MREIPSMFHFWETQSVQDIVESGWIDRINPSSGFEGVKEGRLRFNIPGNESFINLQKSYLYLKLKLVGSGTVPGSGTSVITWDAKTAFATSGLSVVNAIAHSLFRHVEVMVGGQTITKGDQNYGYRTYLELLCNTTKEAQETYFHVIGWKKDIAGSMDSDASQALSDRRNFFNADGIGEFIIKPHTGINMIEKNIIPFTDIIFTLERHSRPEFYMRAKTHTVVKPFDIEIIEARYDVQRYKATVVFNSDFELMLKEHPVVYNLKDSQVHTCTIPATVSNYSIAELFRGVAPRRIMICFVETSKYNGSYTTNPYNFDHCKVESLRLLKNGLDSPYPETITNFQTTPHTFMQAYHRMMMSLAADYNDHVVSVTPEEYSRGFFFYSFFMAPDQEAGSDLLNTSSRPAQIKIEVRFSEALKESVQMIVYSEHDTAVQIDFARRVVVTYK